MARQMTGIFLSCCFAVSALNGIALADGPTTQPAATKPAVVEPADKPAVKFGKGGKPDARFMQLHEQFLKRGKEGPIGVLFLGDSITEGWTRYKGAVWTFNKSFGMYSPANFGIGGDRTQHVLWRMDNGELEGIHPKVVVLMIGTNNTGGNTAEQITVADEKIISELHQKLPDTKVLVLGIFPRGADPKDPKTAALREKIAKVNSELAKLDDGDKTRYLDMAKNFLTEDGTLTPEIMPDALHPREQGYQIWADTMKPLLDEMMK
jgi:lysophospholipase L1-like esterase